MRRPDNGTTLDQDSYGKLSSDLMCLLILLRGIDPDYPILVANNRDELRSRPAAPPGLFVGREHRMISPRDRQAAGTWLAINDRGMFAGVTNVAGEAVSEVQTTRGELPHLALDQSGIDSAAEAVAERVAAEDFASFQLLVADRSGARIVVHRGCLVEIMIVTESVIVLSNEHLLGELVIPGLDEVEVPGLAVEERLDRLAPLLLDEGERSGHRILKTGGEYGTVASSLIAIGSRPEEGLIWRYAAGEPGEVPYRDYGNLRRRLGS